MSSEQIRRGLRQQRDEIGEGLDRRRGIGGDRRGIREARD